MSKATNPLKSGSPSIARATHSRIKREVSPVVKTRAKTLRLTPQHEQALDFLKAVRGASVNKMVNDAVGEYIQRETARVEVDLADLMTQVKAHRKLDPDFSAAQSRVVEAEKKAIGNDPADGSLYVEAPVKARRRARA